MVTRFRNTLFFMCGMAAVLTMTSAMTGCTSEQTEPEVRRMAEQGAVVFQPSMALSTSWGQPGVDDWGTTRGLTTTSDVAVISFAGSRPMGVEVTRGSRYEGNDVEGQSYQTLKASDTFRVSGYRYDPSKGETVSDVAEPNFFDNVEVSYIGKWQATGSYYIPATDDRTDFFAWFVPGGTEGVSLNGDKRGGLRLDYAVPTDVAKQPDLLTAVTRGEEYSADLAHAVPLQFQHQLTEVNFVVGEGLSAGTITEIAFVNVCTKGTLNVADGTWTQIEVPTVTAYPLNFDTYNNSGRRTGTTILGGLMMIPQQFTSDLQRIQLTITIGDTPYMVYAGLSPAAGGAPQGWRAGEVVTYSVSSSSLPQLKPSTLTVSSDEVTVKERKTVTVTVDENTSDGALSVESADRSIAEATISGTTITIKGVAAGETTVTVRSATNGEYAAASQTIVVTVEEVTGITTLTDLKDAINDAGEITDELKVYLGYQVDADGNIAETVTNAIGVVAFISTSDVDKDISDSRILVISKDDVSSAERWNAGGSTTNLTSTTDLDGYSNTNTLHGKGSYYAAGYLAWNYGVTIPSGGATPAQWFLPSYAQWEAIMGANGIGKGKNDHTILPRQNYWSSTEHGYYTAYDQDGGGNIYPNGKNSMFHVRAVFAY